MGRFLLILISALCLASCSASAQTPQAFVTFTFDDVLKSVRTVGLPILEKYQYPGTVYVETRNTSGNYPDYMNWDDVKAVSDAGWEVGAHTNTHPHLTKLSNEDILDDLFTSTQEFAKHGYSPVDFASPFGDMDDRVLAIIRRHYQSHRTAWPDGTNTLTPDPYHILQHDIIQTTTLEEVAGILGYLQKKGGWVVFQLHGVTPKGEVVGDTYNSNLLEDIVELVHSKGIPVLTVRQALSQFQQK